MRKILIVDDEDILCDLMADLFSSRGYEVSVASCGKEAIKMSQESQFDLVISDVRMPNGDGLDLAKTLYKRDPSFPLVIFVTGYLDVHAEVPGNVKKVFKKPVKFREMASFTEELIGKAV